MIQIDDRIAPEIIRQLASQRDIVPVSLNHVIEESLVFDQGRDFYYGQVAALCFAYQLAAGNLEQQATVGAVLSVISDHIIKKGLLDE